MLLNPNQTSNNLTLAIHSTDISFGFACRENNNDKSDILFIKRIENDLCNNLIFDFNKFISKENLKKVSNISVSVGPANFNASRMIIVLARTISQAINCPLESFSSFEIMSKRIALKNNIYTNNQSFWIYKKLKRKGFIAGKYEVYVSKKNNEEISILEKEIPKVVEKLETIDPCFPANYNDSEDLKELLNLSNKNLEIPNLNSWEKVLPLYPFSPIN